MAPTVMAGNVDNYFVGKGIVSFKKTGSDAYRDVGNVPAFVITPDLTTLEHYSSRTGTKSKDLTIIIEKKATVKWTMEEYVPDNVAMMLFGSVDDAAVDGPVIQIMDLSIVTGALRLIGTNDVGAKCTVDLWNVSITPSGDMEFITDEFGAMEIEGDVLIAPASDTDNAGKFGQIKFTNVAPDAS